MLPDHYWIFKNRRRPFEIRAEFKIVWHLTEGPMYLSNLLSWIFQPLNSWSNLMLRTQRQIFFSKSVIVIVSIRLVCLHWAKTLGQATRERAKFPDCQISFEAERTSLQSSSFVITSWIQFVLHIGKVFMCRWESLDTRPIHSRKESYVSGRFGRSCLRTAIKLHLTVWHLRPGTISARIAA